MDPVSVVYFVLDGDNIAFLATHVHVRYVARPSVCRLSVTFMHPTQAIEIVGNFSTPFGMMAIC